MKLGFGSQLWINYGNYENFQKMLEELSMLHFDGFEMCFGFLIDMYGDSPTQLKALLEKHKLEISACYKGVNYKEPDLLKEGITDAKRTIDFYSEWDCEHFFLDAAIEKPIWGEVRDFRYAYTHDQLKIAAETANLLGEYARNKGMQLSWHTHWGTFFGSSSLWRNACQGFLA